LLTKWVKFGEQKTCLTENEIKGDGSEATSVTCQWKEQMTNMLLVIGPNLTALKVAISNPVMPPHPDLAMCNDMSPEEKAQIQWCNGHTFTNTNCTCYTGILNNVNDERYNSSINPSP
jgi:hypothetical protein